MLYLLPFLGVGDLWGAVVVAPLILWILKKDESPFIDFHGRQAINLEINLAIGGLLIWAGVALGKLMEISLHETEFFILVPIGLAVLSGVWFAIVGVYYGIAGARAAYRGEWFQIGGLFGKKWF